MQYEFINRIAAVVSIFVFVSGVSRATELADPQNRWLIIVFAAAIAVAIAARPAIGRSDHNSASNAAAVATPQVFRPSLHRSTVTRKCFEYVMWAGAVPVLWWIATGPDVHVRCLAIPLRVGHLESTPTIMTVGSVALAVFVVPFAVDWSIKATTRVPKQPPNPLWEIFWITFGCTIFLVVLIMAILAAREALRIWRPTCDFILYGEIVANVVSGGVAALRRVWIAFGGRFFAVGDRPAPFAAVIFTAKVAVFAVPFLPIALLADFRAQIVAATVICIYVLAPQDAQGRRGLAA